MKNKHKIILLKTVIALGGICTFMAPLLDVTSQRDMYGNLNKTINFIACVLYVICYILGILFFVLIFTLKIKTERTKSSKYKIKLQTYEEVYEYFYEKQKEDGYNYFETYEGTLYKIDYAIKKKYNSNNIFMIMNIPEMTEEIYNIYEESYFEDFGNNIIDNNEIDPSKTINIICVICVEHVNKYFSKYTEENVSQDLNRYNLPVGISFGSQTLYIATQEDGFAKGMYKKLKKKVLEYVDEIIIKEEDK